jgi:hypothetical protein
MFFLSILREFTTCLGKPLINRSISRFIIPKLVFLIFCIMRFGRSICYIITVRLQKVQEIIVPDFLWPAPRESAFTSQIFISNSTIGSY